MTHALATALHEDRELLRAFLTDVANCSPPRAKGPIKIYEQTYPGEIEAKEEETGHGAAVEKEDKGGQQEGRPDVPEVE